jgi:3-methyladenine DNA glycosylase AlkD
MKLNEVMLRLEESARPDAIKFMAKYGITADKIYGTSLAEIRAIAKEIGYNNNLAQKLWEKGYRETMIIASLIYDPKDVTEELMEEWVKEFDYWEICDQVVSNLFGKTEFAKKKALEWSTRHEEFVKRTAFVLMARSAVHDKKEKDELYEEYFLIIYREASDDRNNVKKAVNWALRQIGKRNITLNKKAIDIAKEIQKLDSKAARWIASDALKELTSEKIQQRLKKRNR